MIMHAIVSFFGAIGTGIVDLVIIGGTAGLVAIMFGMTISEVSNQTDRALDRWFNTSFWTGAGVGFLISAYALIDLGIAGAFFCSLGLLAVVYLVCWRIVWYFEERARRIYAPQSYSEA